MQRFDENEMALGVRRYCGVCSVVILGVLSLLPLVRAQQNEVSSLSACVPSDLAALIVPDGLSVRVSSALAVPQLIARGKSAKGGVACNTSADRAVSDAYKYFQH